MKAPSYDFGGVEIEWLQTIRDTTNERRRSWGIIYNDETGWVWSKPYEYNGILLYSYYNYDQEYRGTLFSGINSQTGEILWQNNYSPRTKNGYGYNYYLGPNVSNGEAEFIGMRTFDSIFPQFNYPYNGYITSVTIDINTGNEIEYRCFDKQKLTFPSLNWQASEDGLTRVYYRLFNLSFPSNRGYDSYLFPVYYNMEADSIMDNWTAEPDKFFTVSNRDRNGFPNTVRTYGPFKVNENEYAYCTNYARDNEVYLEFWKADGLGNILLRKDISEASKVNDNNSYVFDADFDGKNIILGMRDFNGFLLGHRGIAIINTEGDVLLGRTGWNIDGKTVQISRSAFLDDENILHIIRFHQSNDLYFYKENIKTNAITYINKLIDANSKTYGFLPHHMLKTQDNGIVVSGYYAVDTVGVIRLQEGSWQALFKISAEALGLSTTVEEVHTHHLEHKLYPKPAADRLYFDFASHPKQNIQVQILDMMGRQILISDVSMQTHEVDVSTLPNGIYFYRLMINNIPHTHGKWVKGS